MKRGWKVFWIICLVVALIGGGLMIAGIALGASLNDLNVNIGGKDLVIVDGLDEDESEVDDDYEIIEEVKAYENIHKLDIEVAAVELDIRPSMTDEVMVETSGISPKLKYKCAQDGDVLKMRSVTKIDVLSGIKEAGKITIYIPQEQLEYAKIVDGAGEVYIEAICAKEMIFDIGAGEAGIDGCVVDTLTLNCGAGEISAQADIAKNVTIECGVGEITLALKGEQEDFDYDVECGIGKVQVGDHSFEGVAGEHHESHGSSKKVSIECGIGEVNIDYYH